MRAIRILAPLATVALAGTCLVLPGTAAQASTLYVWTGEGDGSQWSDPANWSPQGVPNSSADSARIDSGQIWVDGAYDLNELRILDNTNLIDDGGSITATSFVMSGGTLQVPVKTASFTANGSTTKEITSTGSIDATLVRGGNSGEASILEGTLALRTNGVAIKVRANFNISARIDARGANLATIEAPDANCPSSFVCGIVVSEGNDSYGPAMEGVTLTASKITFTNSSTLALRQGTWKPGANARIVSVNGAEGVVETGSAFPTDQDVPEQEVVLPATVTLDGTTWRHVSGLLVAAKPAALTPGMVSGEFVWSGGTLQGRLTTKAAAGKVVKATISAESPDAEILIDAPSRGGGNLTVEGGGEITADTTLTLDDASTLDNKSPAATPFIQRMGSTITTLAPGSRTPKVTNSGSWTVAPDANAAKAAVIDSVPFVSSGALELQANAALSLTGGTGHSVSGATRVLIDNAEQFGRIELVDGAPVRLAGTLTAVVSPSAALVSGDDMLVVGGVDDQPASITGTFSSVAVSGTLAPGIGLSGELVEAGYVVSAAAAEELALTASAPTRIRVRTPWTVTYVITNKAGIAVTPTLNLPTSRVWTVTEPSGATCTEVRVTLACELAAIPAGGQVTVTAAFTFTKPGRARIPASVTSPGYNPNPNGAKVQTTVNVTAR